MNTYIKYCPNVFVAKCEEKHEKGEIIELTTKWGQEHDCEVHNFLGTSRDGFYIYSVTRTDGFDFQERARRKAERLNGYAANAEKRSNGYYRASDMSEGATGIPFGQPILVGHHSEARHRKTIERAWNNMGKSVEESRKAEEYQSRAAYWEKMANKINLSMPESIEYYEFELEKAKATQKFYKENPDKREHSFSLTYATKRVKEMEANLATAKKLWGDN